MTGLAETIGFLRERLTRAPRVVLVLGSGLGGVVEFADPLRIAYEDIPGFPNATVSGHAGELLAGIWGGAEVAVLLGRFHLYEGRLPGSIVLPLRALAVLGADHLIVTNAAGGIRSDLGPGDLMLISDHINFMFRNPLIGPVLTGEERFPDMAQPYDEELRRAALTAALELGIQLREGVYAGVPGPSYETPAEIRMLRRLGADAVGMSTVPEVLVARALGMRVFGVSCITNRAAGLGGLGLTHEEVLSAGRDAGSRLAELLETVISSAISPNLAMEAAG